MSRAEASGYSLNEHDARLVKGMLRRQDRQHDIAAWFGVNSARINDIAQGKTFMAASTAPEHELPPTGPYLSGRSGHRAVEALEDARTALELAQEAINQELSAILGTTSKP